MKRVLLLNPPATEMCLRDYYCSHVSKGRYYWPPADLLVLSGVLDGHVDVCVLDALVSRLSFSSARLKIASMVPDGVIAVVGAASWKNDICFLKLLKDELGCFIAVSGDYPLAEPEKVLQDNNFIDAVVLDFTDSGIVDCLMDNGRGIYKNIVTRSGQEAPAPIKEVAFTVPVPRHDLFDLKAYHLPHIEQHPFTTIMTDFGCPFACTFCPFERIDYKIRDMGNVVQELSRIQSLGVRELWLRDQSFGSARQHAFEFCDVLKKMTCAFSWSCEMRVDAADEVLLRRMKAAGCHTVMFGVESARQEVLDAYHKKIHLVQVEKAFKLAKKTGLRTLAHFMIGLAGESRDSELEMIRFALALDPDYASFNVASPLWNTTFRDQASASGWLKDLGVEIDSSNSFPVFEPPGLTCRQIWELRKVAIRQFYFRPSYFIKQIKGVRSLYRARSIVREGLSLLLGR